MGRESLGHADDARVDKENERAKLPLRKRFVPIEEVPSGAPSVEDQIEQRAREKQAEADEKYINDVREGHKDSNIDYHEGKIVDDRFTEEPKTSHAGQPFNPSASVSGSSAHQKELINAGRYDESGKTSKQLGKEKDTAKQKMIDRKRRAGQKMSPKK